MTSSKLYERTLSVLTKDDRLVSEGELLKNKCIELALNSDRELMEKLASDEKLKEYFFVEAGEYVVFKEEEFVNFIDNKTFLSDSYTTFRNKIGLKRGDEYYSENENVVLAWPYKDCILEGGQKTEEENRGEKLWNKELAPEEIDVLTKPKALDGFKRIKKGGETELSSFSKNKDNLFLRGNNLLALYSIVPVYKNDVDLIYLDPPYNTGNDSFKYNDDFNQSTWLTFMKNRLEVAKQLLSKDGCIFIHIDDHQQAELKLLMDEVFGESNFINNISVKMSGASGVKMSHKYKRFPKQKEHILFYANPGFERFNEIDGHKTDEWDDEYNIFLEGLSKENRKSLKKIKQKEDLTDDDVKKANEILSDVEKRSLSKKMEELEFDSLEDKENWKFENSYRIIATKGSDSIVRLLKGKKTFPEQDIAVELSETGVLFYYITDFNREVNTPRVQVIFADENIYKHPCDFWEDIRNVGGVAKEGGVELANGKKPEQLLKRIIKMTTSENDIVLDFFAGSGTTQAVSHKMDRRYIGIEQLDYGENDPTVRLRNVIEGDETGISEEVNWEDGGSFVYAELMGFNSEYIDKINKANKDEEFVKIWESLKNRGFISHKVNIDKFEENIEEFNELKEENKKKFLIEVIDKNQLYVNYSEIQDEFYDVSGETIERNNEFYKGENDE